MGSIVAPLFIKDGVGIQSVNMSLNAVTKLPEIIKSWFSLAKEKIAL